MAFFSHCGMSGVIESVYYGVPLLAVGIFGSIFYYLISVAFTAECLKNKPNSERRSEKHKKYHNHRPLFRNHLVFFNSSQNFPDESGILQAFHRKSFLFLSLLEGSKILRISVDNGTIQGHLLRVVLVHCTG